MPLTLDLVDALAGLPEAGVLVVDVVDEVEAVVPEALVEPWEQAASVALTSIMVTAPVKTYAHRCAP